MSLRLKREIKELMKSAGFSPKKLFGQNFLLSEKVLKQIARVAGDGFDGTILEIGPGLGFLTEQLLKRPGRIVAIEKDRLLASYLKNKFEDAGNFELLEDDALKILADEKFTLAFEDYRVAANLPYYLTSRFMRIMLELENPPKEMILMVQKEVADRICAQPPKTNLLATAIQYFAKPKKLFKVQKSCFWPQPRVDSAVIKITTMEARPKEDKEKFFSLVKTGFSQKRKTLFSNLKKSLKIDESALNSAFIACNLDKKTRAETLSQDEWKYLLNHLK